MAVPGMALTVECPACEARFEIFHSARDGQASSHQSECPTCHFRFATDENICRSHRSDSTGEHDSMSSVSLPLVPGPRWLDKSANDDAPPIAPPVAKPPKIIPPSVGENGDADKNKNEASEQDADFNLTPPGLQEDEERARDERLYDSSVEHSSELYQAFPDEERQVVSEFGSPVRVAIAVLLGFISVASLTGIILLLTRSDGAGEAVASTERGSDTTSSDTPGIDSTSGDSTSGSERASTTEATGEDATTVSAKADDESLKPVDSRFVSTDNRIYDRIWQRNSHHLVRIDLGIDASIKSSMGFVIDRRGWVVTGIDQLNKFESTDFKTVFAPAWNQTFEQTSVGEPTGVARALANYNLVVLQVPGVATSAVADKDTVVDEDLEMVVDRDFECENDAMLYALSPVAKRTGQPIIKCRIFDQRLHSEVPAEARKEMETNGIGVGEGYRWIVHDGLLNAPSSPCPLFSRDGDLVAIHMYYDDRLKTGYAMKADFVPGLKTSGVGERDLTESDDVKKIVTRFGTREKPDAEMEVAKAVDPENEKAIRRGDFATIEVARELFTACDERIDWLPKSMDEYHQIQEFADYLLAMDDVARDLDIAGGHRVVFESEADGMYDRIGAVEWPSEEQIEEQNQFALAGLKIQGQPFFGYVRVDRVAGIAREVDGKPTVLLELIGTDQKIVVLLDKKHGELKRNSKWLLFGRDDAKTKVIRKFRIEKDYALIHAYRMIGKPQ